MFFVTSSQFSCNSDWILISRASLGGRSQCSCRNHKVISCARKGCSSENTASGGLRFCSTLPAHFFWHLCRRQMCACSLNSGSIPQARQVVELQNRDGYPTVFIHLDNEKSDRSVSMPNGSRLTVLGSEGDGCSKGPQWIFRLLVAFRHLVIRR